MTHRSSNNRLKFYFYTVDCMDALQAREMHYGPTECTTDTRNTLRMHYRHEECTMDMENALQTLKAREIH